MSSTILGLIIYPYYEIILNGPIGQISKLPKVISILNDIGIYVDREYLLICLMIIRVFRNICFDIIYTFCVAYMIYCWYYYRAIEGFKILVKAVVISTLIIIIYGIIDTFYLLGSDTATNILVIINPFLHEIASSHGWWPPLLWKEQLRSIFEEPSYYGIYASFAMPFLWYKFIEVEKIKYKIIFILIISGFTFCLFLTKSRTAIALFGGECIILILYLFYLQRKILWKKVIVIFTTMIITFFGSNLIIANMGIWHNENKINSVVKIEEYISDNVGSLISLEKRSNTARYSIIIANFKIGMDYFLLGVGTNLNNAYIPEYLPAMSKNNPEVKMWIDQQKKEGILKDGFPNLCEYTSRLAQNGFLGLIIFLLPAFVLLKILIMKIKEKNIIYVIFSISFIGILVSGVGTGLDVAYYYWILLGLGYAICRESK